MIDKKPKVLILGDSISMGYTRFTKEKLEGIADMKTYVRNLEAMIIKMKATGARLIFATTTPYPEGTTPYRDPKMAAVYNKAALELCEKYDIKVDDLYSLVEHRLDELQRPQNVHFKPSGSKVLGYQVAESVIQVLKTKK